MDDQVIIVCDDNGNPTGEYIPKEEGHTGVGRRHLAICVLLEDSKGEVLLQKRKHKIFDNIWDVTGATNNLHINGHNEAKPLVECHNESFEEAANRCLKEEYGIEGVELEVLGSFNYFAKYGDLCENEHCAILVGEYDGEMDTNLDDAYEVKWMSRKEFLKNVEQNPEKYTPWCKEAVKILKEKGFFN